MVYIAKIEYFICVFHLFYRTGIAILKGQDEVNCIMMHAESSTIFQ